MEKITDYIKTHEFFFLIWPYWLITGILIIIWVIAEHKLKSKTDSQSQKKHKIIILVGWIFWIGFISYSLLFFWLYNNYYIIFLYLFVLVRPLIQKIAKAFQQKLDKKVDTWADKK